MKKVSFSSDASTKPKSNAFKIHKYIGSKKLKREYAAKKKHHLMNKTFNTLYIPKIN